MSIVNIKILLFYFSKKVHFFFRKKGDDFYTIFSPPLSIVPLLGWKSWVLVVTVIIYWSWKHPSFHVLINILFHQTYTLLLLLLLVLNSLIISFFFSFHISFLLFLFLPFSRERKKKQTREVKKKKKKKMGSLGSYEGVEGKKAMWLYPKIIGTNPSERWGHTSCFFKGHVYVFGVSSSIFCYFS